MAAALSKPVWTWVPGESEPTRCGTFAWQRGFGEFFYEPDYLHRSGSVALDPVRLPFTRSRRPHRETKQVGVFGVLRDATPEGYGLEMLQTIEGRPLDILDCLEVSLGDGVGAIEVCDDIQRKVDFHPIGFTEFMAALARMPEGVAPSRAVRDAHGVVGTTLGGERPKLTVLHRGQQWIAKLQDRGDAPNSPLREYLAMTAARAAGVNAADVEFHRCDGPHQLVVVRRFDRHVDADRRVQRRLYASAHTLLGLDSGSTRGDPARSYPYLAAELQRWCGAAGAEIDEMKRELWRRMAFNAICGNGDDHPRNHGVVHVHGLWQLAPAFDIAPYITYGGAAAMNTTRDGHMQTARWALLRDCETFAYDETEAAAFIDQAVETMQSVWSSERARLGFHPDDAPTPEPAWLDTPAPADLAPKRRPRARRSRIAA